MVEYMLGAYVYSQRIARAYVQVEATNRTSLLYKEPYILTFHSPHLSPAQAHSYHRPQE